MGKLISKNKVAYFNYHIFDKYEAGIVLKGWEIKSIRAGSVQLKGSFISFMKKEPYISNMQISQYMGIPGDETGPRKLLLHKSQINKLINAIKAKGYTLVPLDIKWSAKGLVKVDIALAKGKSKVDKREVIKKRDTDRRLNKVRY